MSSDPGIGIEAAKVVSECIHSSRVKEMGLSLLRKNTKLEEDDEDVLTQSFDRLGEDEVEKFQLKLARSLVVFMELLHLLIARNRDLLLDVIQSRKKNEIGSLFPSSKHNRDMSLGSYQSSNKVGGREISSAASHAPTSDTSRHGNDHQRRLSVPIEISSSSTEGRPRDDASPKSRNISEDYNANTGTSGSLKDYGSERTRTDSAIGLQRELQLAFINIVKDLFPMIHGIMENDTPRWLKQCCQDSYFSSYTYRQAKIRKFHLYFLFVFVYL